MLDSSVGCGLTQDQTAEHLGVRNEAVSRIDRGLVMPNIERLLTLAKVCGSEAADLLTEAIVWPQDQARHLQTRPGRGWTDGGGAWLRARS